MIIKTVCIENFFCYLGKNPFAFSQGLNIISGRNSSGKSQLFNAFHWTFFGKIFSDENSNKKRWADGDQLTIYHKKLEQDSQIGDEFTVSVEIAIRANNYQKSFLEVPEEIDYQFRRHTTFKKTEKGVSMVLPSELRIEYVIDGETFHVNRAENNMLIDSIFPASIRKFMWYQGETMEDLFDFSHSASLNNAINEISYYPKYDFMDRTVKSSEKSISDKVRKELNKLNRLSTEQTNVYNTISYLEKKLDIKETDRQKYQEDIQYIEDELIKIDQQFSGIGHFMDMKIKLARLEEEQRYVVKSTQDIEVNTKEKLINIWMLNGCGPLIETAEDNLYILHKHIQDKQQHQNPVPMNLPGPEYVEVMLQDKTCHICERPVEEGSDAMRALERRLNDFREGAAYKLMQENFTDLNRFRKKLQTEIPMISAEIAENQKKKDQLLKKRTQLYTQIENIFKEVGSEGKAELQSNANLAQSLSSKMRTYRADKDIKIKRLSALETEIREIKTELLEKKAQRDGFTKKADVNLVESVASDYIDLFAKVISKLKNKAYAYLIGELENESNRLYSLYLDNREQGRIVFDKGVHVVDYATNEVLVDLNMGEQVAQKLAVANAFLSLSSKKMDRSYPLLADAPSSDLDAFNTYNLTVNIRKSFEQIIIMSKDYVQFPREELLKLIDTAGVSTFYAIQNDNIDGNDKSRANRKSVADKIK